MSTLNGLPAHVLLVHFIVVLAPLDAVLIAVSGVWPSARKRLIWWVVGLTAAVAALTPLTIDAGEWLRDRLGNGPDVAVHAELGDTMTYVAIALGVGAVSLAALEWWQRRPTATRPVVTVIVAVAAVLVATATATQVYRIGDSGSRAAWADQIAPPNASP